MDGAQPGQELVQSEGFGDVVVGSGVQCFDLVVGAVPGGEDQNRDAAPLPEPGDDSGAVHVGQAQVQDDDAEGVPGR